MTRWLEAALDRLSGPTDGTLHEKIDAAAHLLDESTVRGLHYIATVRNRLFHGETVDLVPLDDFENQCKHLQNRVKQALKTASRGVAWASPLAFSEFYVHTAPADDIELVVTKCNELEQLLRQKFGAEGRGLIEKLTSVRGRVPREVIRNVEEVARIRNLVIHKDVALDATAAQSFEEACSWAASLLEGRSRTIQKVDPWKMPADTLAAQGWRLNICLSFVVVLLSSVPSLIAGTWITVRLAPGIAELDDFWLKSILLAASPSIPFCFAAILLIVVYLAAFVGAIPLTGLMLLSPRWRQFHPKHVLGLASLYLPHLEEMLRGRVRLGRRVITIATHFCGVIGAGVGIWVVSTIYKADAGAINGVIYLLFIGMCYLGGGFFGMGIGLWISAAGAVWTCIDACLHRTVIQDEDIPAEAEAV